MPRFFFDLTNGNGLVEDDSGQELDSLHAVHRTVLQILPDIVRDELSGRLLDETLVSDSAVFALRVRDQNGRAIMEASLSWQADWSI